MSRRTERVGKLLQQTIGQILLAELSDPRIDTARTSVTRVRVQEDLLRAKVFVSVLGNAGEQRRSIAALNHAAGRIQALVGQQIQLRHLPVLKFLPDESFKAGLETLRIIGQAMEEIKAKENAASEVPGDGDAAAGAEDEEPEER